MAEFAGLYNYTDEHEKADTLYERCIAIYTDAYGERNTFSAFLMSDWAMNLLAEGRIEKADSLVDRSLELQADAPYARHESVYNITHQAKAVIQGATGQYAACRETLRDMYEFNLHALADIFSYASDETKLAFAQRQPPLDDKLFALALHDGDPATLDAAFEMLLKCKSLLIDALSSDRAQLMCSGDPGIMTSIETHRSICSEISNITLSADPSESREHRIHRLDDLFEQKDSVEAELSRECARFQDRLHQYDFSIADVVRMIPEDAVLIEYVRSRTYRFDGPGTVFERYGDAHYLAFTLDRSGSVSLNDLGDAAEVDSLVWRTRQLISDAGPYVYSARGASMETQLKQVTGLLYDKLVGPLESHLKGRKSVLVSPDGALNLLPLEILATPDDSYFIEKYHVSYLSTGRDLLRFQKSGVDSGDDVVIVNPDFDRAGESGSGKSQLLKSSMFEDVTALQPVMRGAPDCLSSPFSPLSHGKEEGEAIAKALAVDTGGHFREFSGTNAVEEVLKSFSVPPRLLHLATHGYFCGEPGETSGKDVSGSANPLLRTGLALAGANRVIKGAAIEDGSEDGILTGYEVSGLNLVGTELVTLSACETGIGDIVEGEGVFGLRRAFQQAGAKAILMTMWKVPDKETARIMSGFYPRWLNGMRKSDALRESALEMLREARARFGHGHPLLWGGFILFGDPS
jgi:CHAT domain-containing protein